MPGETTQRIEACSSDRDHEPHPVVGVAIDGGEDGWCPGVPRRHPDGSLVAPVPDPVPLAGAVRALSDEVRAAQADIAAREPAAGEPAAPRDSTRLRAEEYAVTVSGIPCRVARRDAGSLPRGSVPDAPAWWDVAIGRAYSHETTITEGDRSESKLIVTGARFAFNPDDLDSEQIALERAGSYCEQVARALSALWQEQERIYDAVTGAVSRARVVCGALPEK